MKGLPTCRISPVGSMRLIVMDKSAYSHTSHRTVNSVEISWSSARKLIMMREKSIRTVLGTWNSSKYPFIAIKPCSFNMAQQKTHGKDQGKTSLVEMIVTHLISVNCNTAGVCCQQTQTTSIVHLRNNQSLIQEGKANDHFKLTCPYTPV